MPAANMAGILSPYLSGVISQRGFFILFITATALWTELWKTPSGKTMLTSRMGLATYATPSTFRIVRKMN